MMKSVLTISIFVTLTILQACPLFGQTQRETGIYIGNFAPPISMENTDGEVINLSDLKGNIVLIDFWASWCRPCRRENPVVVKAYNDLKDKEFKDASGFKVFSVSLDKNKEDWIKAIEEDQLTWDSHVSDLLGWRSGIAKTYNVRAIPMNFLLDKNGIIIAKNLRGEELIKALNNLVTF
ncbi:MAG: hypothetical protein B6D64_13365 [Bacteroidetes bacterium 4484_276]|nr:MAG: hypothetical protein B6D64_13365 [Bacteroidetes bacterium 4484_276]OYT14021.1 MAG: alkyl hydroperoxide reductase [Bacteroidetes bacterium 4572_114]